jgi:hypothetical protein
MMVYDNDTIIIKVSDDMEYSTKQAIAEDFRKLYPNNIVMVMSADKIKSIDVIHKDKDTYYTSIIDSLSSSASTQTYADVAITKQEEPTILDKTFIY